MSDDREKLEVDWDASWEGSSRRLLKLMLRATPAQRLAWLEEAILIAYRSGALVPRKIIVPPQP